MLVGDEIDLKQPQGKNAAGDFSCNNELVAGQKNDKLIDDPDVIEHNSVEDNSDKPSEEGSYSTSSVSSHQGKDAVGDYSCNNDLEAGQKNDEQIDDPDVIEHNSVEDNSDKPSKEGSYSTSSVSSHQGKDAAGDYSCNTDLEIGREDDKLKDSHKHRQEGGSNALSMLPSFLSELQDIVDKKNTSPFATWYSDNGQQTKEYTFQDLWEEAGVIAHHLREKWGAEKGDRVVLCYNFGLHFFASFLGCLQAGVTAVLVYPPGFPLVKSLTKMNKVVSDCEPIYILTDTDVNLLKNADRMNFMSKSRELWPRGIEFKVTDKLAKFQATRKASLFRSFTQRKESMPEKMSAYNEPSIQPDDIAFLQYTSGSTGNPKGVMVTFSALQANVRLIRDGLIEAYVHDGSMPDELSGFSWLPQYHDLGLIYGIVVPFASGWRMHMMSPISFIKKPLLWLELMSRLRIEWSIAPDFAFNLVVRKFSEADKKPSLDLSSIRHIKNAAEPVRLDTYHKFSQAFSEYGLRKDWFTVGYGLAESVVGVCGVHGYIVSTPDENRDNFSRVAIGKRSIFDKSLTLKIVSQEEQKEVQDGEIGEIWISGPSVAAGYFRKPDLSEEVFRAKLAGSQESYLRTGDLGFFEKDHLFICGRIKDLIIANGANYYPQDIEMAVQDATPAVRPGCVAAFSKNDVGDDGIVEIVFEIRKNSAGDADQVCRSARAAIADATGLQANRIVAIVERTIPKTTSGKIQRKATRAALHAGELHVVHDFDLGIHDCFDDEHSIDKNDLNVSNICPTRVDKEIVNDSKEYQGDPDDDFSKILWRVLGIQLLDNKKDITWSELGLTSLTATELHNEFSINYPVELGIDCFEQYSTPALLKKHLLTCRNETFPTKMPDFGITSQKQLSWRQLGMLQILGAAILLIMFTIPVVPAWYVGKALSQNELFTIVFVNGNPVRWFWFPLAVPAWMVGFTVSVIIAKWVVVGRYKEQEMLVRSFSYLRWWFVDRAVYMWEIWVGRFIVDTPLLWLVYNLMGANIHISAELKATVREFDLVDIGSEASVKFPICCRRFVPWEQRKGPSLRCRKITVGSNVTVMGMILPGASVGDNSIVERLSVIDEGAQVPACSCAVGNPAFKRGNISQFGRRSYSWKGLGALKIVWLLVEMYAFFGALLVSQMIWNGRLSENFRYTPLLYWVVWITTSSLLLLVISLILKWLFIGYRRTGPFTKHLWQTFADWAADYHFRIATEPLIAFLYHSRVWNVIFKLFGMQVDLFSKFLPDHISPSAIDLIHLEKAFTPMFTFETNADGSYKQVSIVNSNIGYMSHIEAGTTIAGKNIPPMSRVGELIKGNERQVAETTSPWSDLLSHETKLIFFYATWFAVFVTSLVPAYETWHIFMHYNYKTIFVLPLVLVVQTITWVIVLFMLQLVTFLRSTKRSEPWCNALYLVYHTASYNVQIWSFLHLFWGSPIIVHVLRFLGADVKGHLIFFGRAFDFPYLCFEDMTIVDSSYINGHFGLLDKVTLGPCKVGGVVHFFSFYYANGSPPSSQVSGPLRAYGFTKK